jgi:hypothetical protein
MHAQNPSKTKEDIKPSIGRKIQLGINKNHENIVTGHIRKTNETRPNFPMMKKPNISRAPSPALLRVPLSWVLSL